MKESTKELLKEEAVKFGRTVSTIIIASVVIVAGLTIAFSGQTAEEKKLLEETKNANLAIACVLSLPVGETGRDPVMVSLCFTQYDLEPPLLHQ
jgi:hypothetical protein